MNTTNLNEYKYCTMEICKQKGWTECSLEKVWLLLTEEIGELAGSIRRNKNYYKDNKKSKIEDELGDVFSYLFQIAGMLDIDLDLMWQNNQVKAINKTYLKDKTFHYKNDRSCTKHIKSRSNRAKIPRMVQYQTQYDNCQ